MNQRDGQRAGQTADQTADQGDPVRIAPELLAAATLRSVIEEFVTRDGTELTEVEAKVAEVRALLDRGEVVLWFDPETETCSIAPA